MALEHLLIYLAGPQSHGILLKGGHGWVDKGGHGGVDFLTYCDASGGGGLSNIHTRFCHFPIRQSNILGIPKSQLCCNFDISHYMQLGFASLDSILSDNIFDGNFITTLQGDNTAAIKVEDDLRLTKKSHHITCEFHYVNKQIHDGNLFLNRPTVQGRRSKL